MIVPPSALRTSSVNDCKIPVTLINIIAPDEYPPAFPFSIIFPRLFKPQRYNFFRIHVYHLFRLKSIDLLFIPVHNNPAVKLTGELPLIKHPIKEVRYV